MRKYQKLLLIGVSCGIFCMIGYAVSIDAIPLKDIILLFGMYDIGCIIDELPKITYWVTPLLLFQIVYGTYIYRRFCTANVYYFSRTQHRGRWLLIEELKLFLYGVVYLLLMLLSGIGITYIFTDVPFDKSVVEIFLLYITVFSLYLFVYTLAINVLSIMFNSNVGFAVAEAVNIFWMTTYVVSGKICAPEGEVLEEYQWMLEINPFYQLIFKDKSNFNDYKTSIVNYAAAAVIIVLISYLVVRRHEFVNSDSDY